MNLNILMSDDLGYEFIDSNFNIINSTKYVSDSVITANAFQGGDGDWFTIIASGGGKVTVNPTNCTVGLATSFDVIDANVSFIFDSTINDYRVIQQHKGIVRESGGDVYGDISVSDSQVVFDDGGMVISSSDTGIYHSGSDVAFKSSGTKVMGIKGGSVSFPTLGGSSCIAKFTTGGEIIRGESNVSINSMLDGASNLTELKQALKNIIG